MHRQRKPRPTHIHFNVLTWECDAHGPHRVVIAGLDDTADVVANLVTKHPTEDGSRPMLTVERIPLEDARRAYYGASDDDMPF